MKKKNNSAKTSYRTQAQRETFKTTTEVMEWNRNRPRGLLHKKMMRIIFSSANEWPTDATK
jgi:hypothetical protein